MRFTLSSVPLAAAERRSRLIRLAAAATPLAGAVLYNQGYAIPWLLCPLRSLTGIPCPLCGMTRSAMAVARGEFSEAIGFHAFGPILFLMLLIAALHWLLELGVQRRIHTFYGRCMGDRRWRIGFIASFLLYYAIRLQGWGSSGELGTAMQASPIGRWF